MLSKMVSRIERCVVASIGMQKGGVGKTTNALHIAAALAERGARVLLWDVDENYGATKVLGFAGVKRWTTMDVVTGNCGVRDAVISSSHADRGEGPASTLPTNFDFIPASRDLQGLERELGGVGRGSSCLRSHIEELRSAGCYDYIFIDTGPHASATTRSALLVSDYFILSVTPDMLAIGSLPDALRDVMNARQANRNPNLHLLGLVLSCMDRRLGLAKDYERALAEGFVDREGRHVKFETTISTAAAINQAYKRNSLLLKYAPSHRVSRQYRDLAAEVEMRIQQHEMQRSDLAGPNPVGEAAHG